jgi:hypothetical protein
MGAMTGAFPNKPHWRRTARGAREALGPSWRRRLEKLLELECGTLQETLDRDLTSDEEWHLDEYLIAMLRRHEERLADRMQRLANMRAEVEKERADREPSGWSGKTMTSRGPKSILGRR